MRGRGRQDSQFNEWTQLYNFWEPGSPTQARSLSQWDNCFFLNGEAAGDQGLMWSHPSPGHIHTLEDSIWWSGMWMASKEIGLEDLPSQGESLKALINVISILQIHPTVTSITICLETQNVKNEGWLSLISAIYCVALNKLYNLSAFPYF